MSISKKTSIRVNLLGIFYLIVFLLPLIQTELRIRVGAGWQLYIPLIFLLYISILTKKRDFYNYFIMGNVLMLLMLVSNFYGYYIYSDYHLTQDLLKHIVSIEGRMGVESVRYTSSILFFLTTLYVVNNFSVLIKSLRWFLYASLFQGIYGIYEVIAKTALTFLPLVNSKAYHHGTFRVYGTFYEPSQYGQFMLIGILCLFLYKSLAKSHNLSVSDVLIKHYKKVYLVMSAGLMLSLSRAAFVATAFIMFVYLLASIFSLKRFITLISAVLVIWLSFFIYLNHFLSEEESRRWIYLLTSSSGNGLLARIERTFIGIYAILTRMVQHPLGIGQGVAILMSGTMPFMFRLVIESGVLVWIGYIVFLFNVWFRNIFHIKNTEIKINLLLLYLALLIIQFNYSSDNDPWIWFLLAILFKVSTILKKEDSSGCYVK